MPRSLSKKTLKNIRKNLTRRISETNLGTRRKLFRIAAVFVVVFLAYSFLGGNTGFIRIAKLHIEKHRLTEENHNLMVELIDAEMTSSRLQNDLDYIEFIARTRHLLSRSGEIIYRIK